MRIIRVVGASTRQEKAAVVRLVKAFARGAAPGEHLAANFPRHHIEVQVTASADAQRRATFVFENGTVTFRPDGEGFDSVEWSPSDEDARSRVH